MFSRSIVIFFARANERYIIVYYSPPKVKHFVFDLNWRMSILLLSLTISINTTLTIIIIITIIIISLLLLFLFLLT